MLHHSAIKEQIS